VGGIAPGARVADRYVVLEELGRGGMGVVFLARDEREERDVAIKVLREAPEGEAARRLQREARAVNDLDPKGVAHVYEVGETPARELYLVMEFVPGRTLRSLMREARVGRTEALRILRAVATTLGQAHRAGLVHRDVKPDNVIVSEGGRVVLLDFGIVKRLAAGEETAHLSTQLTAEGSVIGTPAYLSPEQALGRGVGPETDQFALAVMAYELLSGKLPWTAKEVTTILAQVLAETPAPPSSVDTQLSTTFDPVLSRALSKKAASRFGSVEELADALEAAERGEYVPFEVSETVAAPLSTLGAGGVSSSRPQPAKTARWVPVLSLVAVVAGLAVFAVRGRARVATPAVDAAALALAGPSGHLACPVFEVRGVTDVGARVGAAAATMVCARAAWFLGGRSDRVLPPGSLLDLPREPVSGLADPYAAPDVRARTLDTARARGTAYLDGTVTREATSWHVALVVRAPDAREIAHAEESDPAFPRALTKALDAAWQPPLAKGAIDPDVARWTSLPDARVGLALADLTFMDSAAGCADVRARARELGNAFFWIERSCAFSQARDFDAGAPTLDESSPPALATSVLALSLWGVPIAIDEAKRLGTKLEGLRDQETSSLGRAMLGKAAGYVWAQANELPRAGDAFWRVVKEDPLVLEAWQWLVLASARSSVPTAAIAAAWIPSEAEFLTEASSYRGDLLSERLQQARLAFVLEAPRQQTAMHLGRALAEAGRPEEVRAVAATPLGNEEAQRALEAYLFAFVDLHSAKLARAIPRLEAAGAIAANELVVVAMVAGQTTEVATRWAEHFLSLPDADVETTARGYDAPMALCMNAERRVAKRCLDRITALGRSGTNWWGDAGEAFLQGAQRYVAGDLHGAVAAWRPLVASPEPQIVGILPTEAFDRAREPDLAARLDARKLQYTFIAGVSEAAPREAKRALLAGEKARAKSLAESVIQAWEVADVEIPAVAEMRALLKRIQ
jgi:hypothetical protein